jgi:hypothetical protein
MRSKGLAGSNVLLLILMHAAFALGTPYRGHPSAVSNMASDDISLDDLKFVNTSWKK